MGKVAFQEGKQQEQRRGGVRVPRVAVAAGTGARPAGQRNEKKQKREEGRRVRVVRRRQASRSQAQGAPPRGSARPPATWPCGVSLCQEPSAGS